MDMFKRLLSYKAEHDGSTLVPRTYYVDPQLGRWVRNQRILLKKKKLPNDRANLLKSIDFTWDASIKEDIDKNKWLDMYERLVSYTEEHDGSTLVPRKYHVDPKLGGWVHNQRQGCRKKERVKLLNDVDFVWNAATK